MQNAPERMNDTGTCTTTDTPATQPGSRDVLQQTYRDLMALRIKHGAGTPIRLPLFEHHGTTPGARSTEGVS
jgi:hypothetical protein